MPLGPIIKYVGGKTKLLPELRARMPTDYGRYYEPFIGGGALFFCLEPERATVGDTNEALVEMYIAVASQVDRVIEHLVDHRRFFLARDAAYYYEVRESWNAGKYLRDPAARAAAFILLNKTCFNGLWRVNASGQYNVPAGKYKNPGIFDADALRAVSVLLKRTELKIGSYEVTTADAQKGDFVYFDPPYDPISKTSNFTGYVKGGFDEECQRKLGRWAVELQYRGVHVMLSNNDTPLIRDIYRGFKIETVRCARPINSNASKRGEINEVLITPGAP